MRERIVIISIVFVTFCSGLLHAQDLHFSQFYASPVFLNPANTGNFDGEWRISNNIRRQWATISPFNTIAVAYDRQVYLKNHDLGIGVIVLEDIANHAAMNHAGIYLSGSYRKIIDWHYIHAGLQVGYVNKHLDGSDVSFPDQFDNSTGSFNPDMGTSEPYFRESFSSFDVNFGVAWSKEINVFEPHAGLSFFHLNQPKESFVDQDNRLPTRVNFYAGSDIRALSKVYFTPDFMYMAHAGAKDVIMGAKATYVFSDNFMEQSVFAGTYFRNEFNNFDAFILLIGVNYNHWSAGISYDVNMSGLKAATNNRGGFELSIIYRAISTRIKEFTIPCERF